MPKLALLGFVACASGAAPSENNALARMLMSLDPSVGFNPAGQGSPMRGQMSRRAALAAVPGLLWPLVSSAVDPKDPPFINPKYSGYLAIDDERWEKIRERNKKVKDPKTGKKEYRLPETVDKRELKRFHYLAGMRRDTWFMEYVENEYYDPQHKDCPRTVRILDDDVSKVKITGKDSKNGKEWTVFGKTTDRESLIVDFTPKGGPKDVKAEWTGNGWKFPDGNRWVAAKLVGKDGFDEEENKEVERQIDIARKKQEAEEEKKKQEEAAGR